jgi:hypothetical protein
MGLQEMHKYFIHTCPGAANIPIFRNSLKSLMQWCLYSFSIETTTPKNFPSCWNTSLIVHCLLNVILYFLQLRALCVCEIELAYPKTNYWNWTMLPSRMFCPLLYDLLQTTMTVLVQSRQVQFNWPDWSSYTTMTASAALLCFYLKSVGPFSDSFHLHNSIKVTYRLSRLAMEKLPL